jgi:hypothetical protein
MCHNPNRANLSGARNMGSTIRLQIQPDDFSYADLFETIWQQIGPCTDQIWYRKGLDAWQKANAYLVVC